jgi:serine phosphatase RsbU (regulator of sigma subunit)
MSRRSVRPASEGDLPLKALAADLRADLSAALASNGMGGFLWDLASGLIFLDPGALAVFDLNPGEFNGRLSTLHQRMLTEELPDLAERWAAAFADSESHGAYFRVRRSDGAIRWAHAQAAVQRDAAGAALRAVGILRDASAELQHVAQQAILESDRRRQADVVQATTTALAQALTVQDVLTALTSDEILGPVGAVAVSLTVPDQGRLRRLANLSIPEPILRDVEFTRFDDPLPVAEVFRTQKPLFITRGEVRDRYPVLWPYIRETELTSSAVLPLMAQAQPTGVLAILYRGKTDFTPEERNLLLALAATIAQSVQRASLYDEEHAMAVGLQQAMLPANIPAVTGLQVAVRYQPARTGHQIGGDWYDVVPLPAGRVGLVVGDVQGHDIHASAVMGQLRTALRAYAAEGHSPAALVSRASTFLHDLDTDRLATCIYVDLDPATGHAQIVRAGHPGPLIRHTGGRSTRPAVEGGLPLGLTEFGDTSYPTTHLRLGPEDVLMLCTDGLLEFRGMDLEAGERQIEAILNGGFPADLDQLAQHIVATIETRQGQEDDVALLLATRTEDHGPGPAR